MLLKFLRRYKSIKEFNQIELNKLTILTGINGSGKTHLLEAIKDGASTIDDIPLNEVVYFNYNTFHAEKEGNFSSHGIIIDKQEVWDNFRYSGAGESISTYKSQLKNDYSALLQLASDKGKPLLELSKEDFAQHMSVYDKYKNYKQQVLSVLNNRSQSESSGLRSIALKAKKSVDELSEIEFKELCYPINFGNAFLPTQLGKIFINYKYKEYEELVIRKAEAERYQETYPISDVEDFERIYGPKPWEVLEEILNRFNAFNYTISNPEDIKIRHNIPSNFNLALRHKQEDFEISFADLSSGERILFALVLSIYKSKTDGSFPKLLLLDEVDASLHPSMIQNLLYAIHEVFISEHNMKVILASHSPTTIALSEEKWVYLVNKEGPNRIKKYSRKEALKSLTEGFITLEEGLLILDQIADNELNVFTIFTEGNNSDYIKRAITLFIPELAKRVKVIDSAQAKTGKNQLKVLYDFFLRLPHKASVLFVFDCDVTTNYEEINNCYYFIFAHNPSNKEIPKGIENLFSEDLFKNFLKQVSGKDGEQHPPKLRKNPFRDYILKENNIEHFENFKPLMRKIEDILNA